MQAGFKMVELLNRTTADNQQNLEIFNLLKNTLVTLDSATKSYVNLLFYYEFKLCELLGFGIDPHLLANKLNQGELKSIEFIREGNFNNLLNLNISKRRRIV
jgi:recombinational DNA repair protein (RecF pathway)